MEEAVKAAVESRQKEIKEVLQSDLAQAFVARLEVNQEVSARTVESGVDQEVSARTVESGGLFWVSGESCIMEYG